MAKNLVQFFFLSFIGSFRSHDQSYWFQRLVKFKFCLYIYIQSFDIRLLNLEIYFFFLFSSSEVISGRGLVKLTQLLWIFFQCFFILFYPLMLGY